MQSHSHNQFSTLLFATALLPSLIAAGCAESTPDPAANDAIQPALWCEEHGVEEKFCVLCHPEIRASDILLCPEHGNIPEEICTACHPELKQKYKTCSHELPTAFCPNCSPEFAATLKNGDSETGHEHDHHDHHEGEQS